MNQDSQGTKDEDKESLRLREDKSRIANWKRWGPYLSERQWGTVREDYSKDGDCWSYLPHDHARSRAYRWGEDGLAGICDRQARLCQSLALWNTKDAILKERLFGLTGPQGNHGEDVKELYYYLDSTPTHSYMKYLYKYPQRSYPYEEIERVNRERSVRDPEYEIEDTGAFDDGYWDVTVEYAKESANDILMEVTVTNQGDSKQTLHVLPTLWYRNTWVWGCSHEGCGMKPKLQKVEIDPKENYFLVRGSHESLGDYMWAVEKTGQDPEVLFTENETNTKRLFGIDGETPYVKDAFHRYIVNGEKSSVNPKNRGTKVCGNLVVTLGGGESWKMRTRLWQVEAQSSPPSRVFGDFDHIMTIRKKEANDFYNIILNPKLSVDEKLVSRQALASLLWTKQFYHYIVKDWLGGDNNQPPPPESRKYGRNNDWQHLYNRDVISMPDKWEYPWYASWDLAFHTVALALVDPEFAKDQLLLFLREWYMHPNGQIPAYEFALGDVNPPVHGWAVINVFRGLAKQQAPDYDFLAKCFQKLSLNFTWWVNRKDPNGRNLFGGGFLGLDNIGVFDRSRPMPVSGQLEQADGTAWMAFFCTTMLDMALTLAEKDPVYEDMASKYFEHFILIVDAVNSSGQGRGLWDEEDGFYYDYIRRDDGVSLPLKVRSLVGLTPLFAVLVLVRKEMQSLPGFYKRANWLINNRPDLAARLSFLAEDKDCGVCDKMLLAVPTKEQLLRLLGYLLDEDEFLSPYGIRSLSKVHKDSPFVLEVGDERHEVSYVPGESNTYLFGGNSNWRGPIWLPMNFLIITSLKRYHFFYGDNLKVECPKRSGKMMNLEEVAVFLAQRVASLFLPGPNGGRPCHGDNCRYRDDPNWRDLILFYEFFHGEDGRGCGASHQTGWTALVSNCLNITLGYSQSGLAPNNSTS